LHGRERATVWIFEANSNNGGYHEDNPDTHAPRQPLDGSGVKTQWKEMDTIPCGFDDQ